MKTLKKYFYRILFASLILLIIIAKFATIQNEPDIWTKLSLRMSAIYDSILIMCCIVLGILIGRKKET